MNTDSKIIDLTHTLLPEIPFWSGKKAFDIVIKTDYKDCVPPDTFRTQKISTPTGIGTHIDAPTHVILGGRTIDQLNPNELITDCVVIDVSHEANEDYLIMPSVVEKFEKEHGEIKQNSFVIFYTGWDQYWTNPDKYHNNYKFPAVDISTAELLLKRDIAGIGADTLSADTGANGFPVHCAILGADKYLVENVANAKNVPPTGARIFILPIKIKDGTEAPSRLVALI